MLPKSLRLKLKMLAVSSRAVTGKINVAVYHDWCYPRRRGIQRYALKVNARCCMSIQEKVRLRRIGVTQAALKILIARCNSGGQAPHNRLFVVILARSRFYVLAWYAWYANVSNGRLNERLNTKPWDTSIFNSNSIYIKYLSNLFNCYL